MEQTEWKYKCKCTVTATWRCSHSCIRRILSFAVWFPVQTHSPFLTNENQIYAQRIKIKKLSQCSTVYGKYKNKERDASNH